MKNIFPLTKCALTALLLNGFISLAQAQSKPNILVIFGDDVGQTNISAYSFGVLGYKTPNLDGLAHSGMMFTDYYAENSCTAGRSTFITGVLNAQVYLKWVFLAHLLVCRQGILQLHRL
ncbi:sulfatase-like hydrolase/transferase [Hufsiella arboris]|uniref:sulfatase-like hydrolase/transferase n=1 Tax=Hufsiella arboris TaxID=2695275 RepID=UPI00192736AD